MKILGNISGFLGKIRKFDLFGGPRGAKFDFFQMRLKMDKSYLKIHLCVSFNGIKIDISALRAEI